MKNIFLTIAFLIATSCYAITPDQLYQEFANKPDSESIKIGKFALSLLKPFEKKIKNISSIQLLNLENCTPTVKDQFADRIKKLDTDKYELVVKDNENGSAKSIYILTEDNLIREIIILSTGEDCCFCLIKGKLSQENLKQMVTEAD